MNELAKSVLILLVLSLISPAAVSAALRERMQYYCAV